MISDVKPRQECRHHRPRVPSAGTHLPGCDGAQDVDDTVGFLLSLLGVLLAKQSTAA